MNRRSFISSLIGLAAIPILPIAEQKKKIFWATKKVNIIGMRDGKKIPEMDMKYLHVYEYEN
jgi:hypothetical protein